MKNISFPINGCFDFYYAYAKKNGLRSLCALMDYLPKEERVVAQRAYEVREQRLRKKRLKRR